MRRVVLNSSVVVSAFRSRHGAANVAVESTGPCDGGNRDRDVRRQVWRKYEKAVTCLIKDRGALLTFYDFPAEHWDHLRTSNSIESVFATVRHRTVRTKGALLQDTARLMVFKLVMAAAKTWRRLKGENQLPKLDGGGNEQSVCRIAPLEIRETVGACGSAPCQRHGGDTGAIEQLLNPGFSTAGSADPAGGRITDMALGNERGDDRFEVGVTSAHNEINSVAVGPASKAVKVIIVDVEVLVAPKWAFPSPELSRPLKGQAAANDR